MASLPTSLCASYITYKADTNQVVSWLAETGLRCGYSLKHDKTSQPHPNNKRPKVSNANHSIKAANTIPTHLFVPLAQHIAQARRKVSELPRGVALSLDRAIQVRKEHNAYYKIQRPEAQVLGSDGVEGHVHFVNILEKVRTLLKHLYPANLVTAGRIPAPSAEEITNRFGHLKVEQVSSSPAITIPDVPTFAKEASVDIKFEAEIVDDYEEAFFAACCLIDDMNEVRQFLRRTWKAYSWQNTDLGSVSVATDNAIAMVRQTIEDFSERFPKHADLTMFVEEVFINQCLAEGLRYEMSQKDPPFDFDASESADTSMLWIKSLWTSCTRKHATGNEFEARKNYQQSPSWQRNTSMTSEERYTKDKKFLSSFLPDYYLFASKLSTVQELFPVHDTITFGLWQVSQNGGEAPFWLLFGLQVFLDIREELGAHTGRGFEDLVHDAKAVLLETEWHCNLEDHYSVQGLPTWSPEYQAELKKAMSRIKCLIKQDIISYILEGRSSSTTGSLKDLSCIPVKSSDDVSAFGFLRNHPLLCGLLVFSTECSMLKLGLELANTIPLIMSSAHLYNALSKTGYLDEEWPDMELLIEYQDDKHLFFGGRPQTLVDCAKKLDLIAGVSLREYARNNNRAAGPTKLNNKNRRQLGTSINMTVTQILWDVYHPNNEVKHLNSARVLKVLGDVGKDRGFDSKTKPTDWLKLLLHKVHDEYPKRKFSYFALDRKCRQVLAAIPPNLKQENSPWFGDPFAMMHCPVVDPAGLPDAVYKVVTSAVPFNKPRGKCPCCNRSMSDQLELQEHAHEQQMMLKSIAGAVRDELHADDEDVGVMTSVFAAKNLAECLQRGGSPDMRIQLKTMLLMHTSSDAALSDINNFFNNRGGDFILKQRAPGARYNRGQATAGVSQALINHTPGVRHQTGQSSSPKPHTSSLSLTSSPSTQSPKKLAPDTTAMPAKKPMGIAEFLQTLPPLKGPLAQVDMKAMCRELMEDGVLDALEQAMLMMTGK